MGKFSGMLFCSDLDGTLFSDDRTASRRNLEAIEYFKAEGGLFTFITGRVPLTAGEICRIVRPNAPYGCLNGGGIYDPAAQRYLWSVPLPHAVLPLVQAVAEALPDVGIQYNTDAQILFARDNIAMQDFRTSTGVPYIPCPIDVLPDNLLKIVFAHYNDDRIQSLARLLASHPLASHFDFIRSERHLYEILPKGVNKGAALLKLADLLGIDPANTIAAGDYHNDVSMLRAAAHSFAVENAVPEAKAAARHLTVSNNHHAIAAIIETLDLK